MDGPADDRLGARRHHAGAGPPEASAGAVYDPAGDTWTVVADAPLATVGDHSAVWADDRMVVWGGAVGEVPVADGAAYDLATDRWTSLPPAPLEPRYGHSAVSTGDLMLVWGGFSGEESSSRVAFADGAAYDPATNAWSALRAAPLSGRAEHSAVWTGRAMVIRGGSGAQGVPVDGAAYDPATRARGTLAPSPLTGRIRQTTVAAGARMIVWDGGGERPTAGGAVYDASLDSWEVIPAGPLEPSAGPAGGFAGVWTGSALVLWGSTPEGDATGASFRPGP